MKIISTTTYSTHIVNIDVLGNEYCVVAQENINGWDFNVRDVDEDEEVEVDTDLYKHIIGLVSEYYNIKLS